MEKPASKIFTTAVNFGNIMSVSYTASYVHITVLEVIPNDPISRPAACFVLGLLLYV